MNTRNKSHFALMTFTYHIVNELFEGLKSVNKQHCVSVDSAIEVVFKGASTLEPNISNLIICSSLMGNKSLIENIIKPATKTIGQYVARNERMPSHIVVREAILSKLMAQPHYKPNAEIRGLRGTIYIVDEVPIETQ